MFRISWALLKPSLGHNAPALLPPAASKIPPRYATSALTYFMGQALRLNLDGVMGQVGWVLPEVEAISGADVAGD